MLWRRSVHRESSERAVENAWRIHDAQMDWTGKVDAKAAFALTIHGALLAAAGGLLPDMNSNLEYVLLGFGVFLLMTGLIVAASVVAPRLRSRHLETETKSNFIYFGHARNWSSEAMARALVGTDLMDQVTRQIVVMAEIAWRKHRRVGASIWFAVVGGGLVLAAGVVSRL